MRLVLAFLLTGAAALPTPQARAQVTEPGAAPAERICRYRTEDPAGVTTRSGELLTFRDPFRVICNDGAEVRASAGVFNQATSVVTLTGNVFFQDPTRTMTSEQAVYEMNFGRLYATGNVVFTDRAEGTTLRGPELEYFRAGEGRPEPLVNALQRPHLTLQRQPPPDAPPAAEPPPPLEVDGDRMTIIGQNNLTVSGNAVIEDPNMRAVADEAEHRGLQETLELRGNAEIHSREYSLTGEVIFAEIPEGSLQNVEVRGRGRMLGQDLDVAAPKIDLVFADDLLQRSIARSDAELAPGQRAVASSPTFRLEADSIDASLPGQRLQTVVAIGSARGEMIDTTRAGDAAGGAAGGEPMPGTDGLVEDGTDGPAPVVAATSPTAADATESEPVAAATPPAAADATDAAPSLPGSSRDTASVPGADGRGAGVDSVARPTAAELIENDWIVGDTITGYFASVETAGPDTLALDEEQGEITDEEDGGLVAAAPDTAVVMERLVAVGEARSLYHVTPERGSAPGTPPGLNFLSAAVIELQFEGGQVQVADVSGLRRGLYLEPVAAAPPADEGEEAAEGEDAEDAGDAEPEPNAPTEPEPAPVRPEANSMVDPAEDQDGSL